MLAWALQRYPHVETLGFDYGQRHAAELEARDRLRAEFAATFPDWAGRLGPDTIVDLKGLGAMSETALTRETPIETAETGLPTSFVPGRNLIFLNFAGAYAYARDIGVLAAGMCEADATGYPDCRGETLEAQMTALRLGLDADIRLETPVLGLSKAASWRLAADIGGPALVEIIRLHSHTCYLGVRETLHDWGYGCGECPACVLRAEGWREFVGAGDT